MSKVITIPLSKQESNRLSGLAIQYGLSLQEFASKVLRELSSEFPEEFWSDYVNAKELKTSFKRAVSDYKKGRFSEVL